jgi:hypothetical protein
MLGVIACKSWDIKPSGFKLLLGFIAGKPCFYQNVHKMGERVVDHSAVAGPGR